MQKTFLLFLFFISQNSYSASAMYEINFIWQWDGTDVEEGRLPNFAHFTDLVGATHQTGAALWQPGGLASPGIERVSEEGLSDILQNEVNSLIGLDVADQFIHVGAPRVFLRNRSTIIDQIPATTVVTLTDTHPEISLISMIAPSPDWFVGVSGLSLMDGDEWIDELTLDLRPWDAGTENGVEFDLTNVGSFPQREIDRISASPFIENPIVAQIEFVRLENTVQPVPIPATLPLLISAVIGAFSFGIGKK